MSGPVADSPHWGVLPGYALFAAVLSMAGLPLYIHAPKVYADSYGLGLGVLGAVLFALRLLDVVQDPALGWVAARLGRWRGVAVAVAAAVMAGAMLGLFAVRPPIAPLVWFGLMMACLFTGFSFLTICFYAQGIRRATSLPGNGHLRLAAWRETGGLLGVCLAAVAPAVFMQWTQSPFDLFAVSFAGLVGIAVLAMAREWRAGGVVAPAGFGVILRDQAARRFLVLALVNAAPVAVSSTLFLFFVEARLAAPGWEGPLLVLFFLAAALSAPLWGRLAARFAPRRVLMAGMTLSILAFGGALALGPGDLVAFSVICLASGAALGADMTLLPALFARRVAHISPEGAEAFGLWSFVGKLSLALAAVVVLPMLEGAGFVSGAPIQTPAALEMLGVLYAGLPCGLKLIALGLLAFSDMTEG